MRRWIVAACLASASCLSSPEGTDGQDGQDGDAGANCPDPVPAPGGACPAECTGCDGATCFIDCIGAGCTVVNCPAGFDCQVSCVGKDRCVGSIVNCPADHACSLLCNGEDACELLTLNCREGRCDLTCTGHALSCTNTRVNCGAGPCSAECQDAIALPDLDCDDACSCQECEPPA